MKRAEILQLAMLQPKIAILDETDSGLDADAVRLASLSIAEIGREKMGLLIITHHDKLLEHNPPDFTHVMLGGRIVETGGIDYWADILPATLLVAIGMGVSVAPLTTTVMASVDPGHVGVASGLNSAVARIAGLIATALLGFVFARGSAETFIAAFRVAVLVGAASAAVAAGCAFLLIRPSVSPARSSISR